MDVDQQLEKDLTKEPEVGFEQYAQSIGVTPKEETKPSQPAPAEEAAPKKEEAVAAPTDDNNKELKPRAGMLEAAGTVAKGTALGVADLAQNLTNAGLSVANGIEDVAASYGLGSGDLIEKSDFIDWSSKLGSADDDPAVRVVRSIVSFAAPVGAAMRITASGAKAVGIGAGIDFATMDPHQERLSHMVLNQAPELKNVVLVGNLLNYLNNKENEGELEGRFKNAVEGTLIGMGVVAGAKSVASLFNGSLKASFLAKKKLIADAAKGVKTAAPNVAEAGVKQADAVIPSVDGQAAVIGQQKQLSFFDESPTYQNAAGETKINYTSSRILDFVEQAMKQNPEQAGVKYIPKTDVELAAQVDKALASPAELEKLLTWKQGEHFSDAQSKMAQVIMDQQYVAMEEMAERIVQSGSPDDLAAYIKLRDTQVYVNNIREGTGSQTAATLRSFQRPDQIGDMKMSEFTKMMDIEQKQEFLNDVIKFSGGEMEVRRHAQIVKALKDSEGKTMSEYVKLLDEKELAAVKQGLKPDSNSALAEYLKSKSSLTKINDAGTFLAYNNMMSSLKTVAGNMTSNILTTVIDPVDNLTATLISRSDTKDAMTHAQNWAGINAAVSSFAEMSVGLKNALVETATTRSFDKGMKKLKDSVQQIPRGESTLKVDFKRNPLLVDDPQVLGSIWNHTGGVVLGLPTKVNGAADAAFGLMNYRMKLSHLAHMEGAGKNLTGEELKDFMTNFLKDPTKKNHDIAMEFARSQTFSSALDPETGFGIVTKAVDNLAEKVPGGKVVMPFLKTTSNIMQYSIEHSPFMAMNMIKPVTTNVLLKGTAAQKEKAIAKAINGTMALGALTWLAHEGIVTGPEPANYKVREALKNNNSGYQPDSIKIGGNYVNISRIEPINSLARLAGTLNEAIKHISEGEAQELAAITGAAIADFMTPEMLTNTLGNLFEAINTAIKGDGTRPAVANFAADLSTRFIPMSALMRDVRYQTDDVMRNTRTMGGVGPIQELTDKIWTRFQAQVPFMSDNLPTARNIFGETVHAPQYLGSDILSPFQSTSMEEPELEKRLRVLTKYTKERGFMDKDLNKLTLELPPRSLKFGKDISIEMTPQEYEKFQLLMGGYNADGTKAGVTLRERMDRSVNSVWKLIHTNKMNKTQYNAMVGLISEDITEFRQRAQEKMKRDPEIRKRFQARTRVMLEEAKISPNSPTLGY